MSDKQSFLYEVFDSESEEEEIDPYEAKSEEENGEADTIIYEEETIKAKDENDGKEVNSKGALKEEENEAEEINSDATKKVADVEEGREIVSQTYNDNVQADNDETDNCEGEVNYENNAIETYVTRDEDGKEEINTHELEEENLNKEDVTYVNKMEDECEKKEEGSIVTGEDNEKEENNSPVLEEEKLIKQDVTDVNEKKEECEKKEEGTNVIENGEYCENEEQESEEDTEEKMRCLDVEATDKSPKQKKTKKKQSIEKAKPKPKDPKEKVIERLISKNGSKYLVKWVNLSDEENTWEQKSTIPKHLLKFYERDLSRLGSLPPKFKSDLF